MGTFSHTSMKVASGVSSSIKAGDTRQVAFLSGFHHALITAGVIALVGALIAFATLQHARHREEAGAPAADFVEAA